MRRRPFMRCGFGFAKCDMREPYPYMDYMDSPIKAHYTSKRRQWA